MKRLPKRRGARVLSDNQVAYLVSGFDFVPVRELFRDEEEERLAWRTHRDKLMSLQDEWGGLESYGLGDRPSAWWKFDAPEPRKSDETSLEYLKRHGLLNPGEEAKTRERDAKRAALCGHGE